MIWFDVIWHIVKSFKPLHESNGNVFAICIFLMNQMECLTFPFEFDANHQNNSTWHSVYSLVDLKQSHSMFTLISSCKLIWKFQFRSEVGYQTWTIGLNYIASHDALNGRSNFNGISIQSFHPKVHDISSSTYEAENGWARW